MPIEIRELNIKATVCDSKSQNKLDKNDFKKELEKMKKEILKECAEEVLQILEEKTER